MVSLYCHMLLEHSYIKIGLISQTHMDLHVQNVKHVKKINKIKKKTKTNKLSSEWKYLKCSASATVMLMIHSSVLIRPSPLSPPSDFALASNSSLLCRHVGVRVWERANSVHVRNSKLGHVSCKKNK